MIVIDKEHHECLIIELTILHGITVDDKEIEDWEILGSGQRTKETVEYESDSVSVCSWSSGYTC